MIFRPLYIVKESIAFTTRKPCRCTGRVEFSGPVLIVTAREDATFCSLDNPLLTHADCGEGDTSLPALVGELYPKASPFSYAIIESTGHDLNCHFSVNKTLDTVHKFLSSNSF